MVIGKQLPFLNLKKVAPNLSNVSNSGKEKRALSSCHILGCNSRPGYDINCLE